MSTLRLTQAEYDRLVAKRQGKAARARSRRSTRWEAEFERQLLDAGLGSRFVREYRFESDRRYRFDFACVPERLAVEIDGAVHRIKKRFHADLEKGQLALIGRWRVLHVSPAQVRDGSALTLVTGLLDL